MTYVLDASAIIALLRAESGGELVRDILLQQGNRCFAHAVNLCEVCYDFRRASGAGTADSMIQVLREAGV